MAKNTKSGLGRGLNSLLGGSIEEATPAETVPVKRETVKFEETPAQTSKTSETYPSKEAESQVSQNENMNNIVSNKGDKKEKKEEEDIYNADDHVVIKEVKQREVLPKETLKEHANVKENPEDVEPNADSFIGEVSLLLVHPNPDQPRTNFKKEEIEELASSIERDGLLQPILVRRQGKEYQIIAGERRWQACKSLNLKKIPIRIKEADDDKALELALIENIQRSDLNPIEEAYGYLRLMERKGLTQSQVAEAVSKGRSTVANSLRLLELPEDAQQLLFEEKISSGHARAILAIPSKEGRQKLSERLVKEKMSVREAEAFARLYSMASKKDDSATRQPAPRSFKTVARSLRESLNTNVRVKSVQGKNKIEIEFQDEDDLKRLFDLISS